MAARLPESGRAARCDRGGRQGWVLSIGERGGEVGARQGGERRRLALGDAAAVDDEGAAD